MYSIEDRIRLDLDRYKADAEGHGYVENLEDIAGDDASQFRSVGVEIEQTLRAGSFLQKDNSILHCSKTSEGVEVMGIVEALEKEPGLNDLIWKLISPDKDDVTRAAQKAPLQGFFIRSRPGEVLTKPLQTCLHIATNGFSQNVHNLVIVEPDSEIHIIAGCSTSRHVQSGLHIGVSEFYVRKGATLKYTMIHEWGKEIYVRPRTVVHVEEGGTYISNYISLKPVGSIQANPLTILEKDARARFNSVLVAGEGSFMDLGSIVDLKGEGARAEIISRAIAAGGTIISRGHLIGRVNGVKGHLECKGLILKDGLLHAIPELSGYTPGVEMSHEAAVGKIDKREIEYLMARGLDEEAAVSTIVRGFLNVEIEGLPAELAERMNAAVKETEKDMM